MLWNFHAELFHFYGRNLHVLLIKTWNLHVLLIQTWNLHVLLIQTWSNWLYNFLLYIRHHNNDALVEFLHCSKTPTLWERADCPPAVVMCHACCRLVNLMIAAARVVARSRVCAVRGAGCGNSANRVGAWRVIIAVGTGCGPLNGDTDCTGSSTAQ